MALSFDHSTVGYEGNSNSEDLLQQIFSNSDPSLIWKQMVKTKDQYIFFYKVLIKTIDALREGRYTEFDAHTTSNCCHGMSMLTYLLISNFHGNSLQVLKSDVSEKLKALEKRGCEQSELQLDTWLPKRIVTLASLYILNLVADTSFGLGRRTQPRFLKNIAPLGTQFCERLVRSLQKSVSNVVASSYTHYANCLQIQSKISGIKVGTWKSYVTFDKLRKDKKNILYAPCIYSMQVLLAYLSQKRAKIAVVNDIMLLHGKPQHFIRLLEGDGVNGFRVLTQDELELSDPFDHFDPVIVFGACASSQYSQMDGLVSKLDEQIGRVSDLILACDIHYP